MNKEITYCNLIYEPITNYFHNFYYEVQVRISNGTADKPKRFTFVLWFDIFDLQDYFYPEEEGDIEEISRDMANEYAELCAYDIVDPISYNDTDKFMEYCEQTIRDYENLPAYYTLQTTPA